MGNKKIDASVALFDLPVVTTCPGAGECRKYCYAMKHEWWGEGRPILRKRVENLIETYKTTFPDDMVALLRASKVKVCRPHDSGDFLSQDYVNKWENIARRCPETNFYAYTKSLHLDFKRLSRLPNFTLIRSFGGKYDSYIKTRRENYARVDEVSGKTIRPGEYVCPEVRTSGKKTEKYCAYNCTYCLNSRDTRRTKKHQIRVVFHKSMGGWTGTRLAPRPPGRMIRPLPAISAQSQKPTPSAGGAATGGPELKRAAGRVPPKGGEARPAASDAEMAKIVEADLAYRHLLLAGFSKETILQRTGVKDLSELRSEHALQLFQQKAAEEEIVTRKPQIKVLRKKRKHQRHANSKARH
jgi:hypothetical protein